MSTLTPIQGELNLNDVSGQSAQPILGITHSPHSTHPPTYNTALNVRKDPNGYSTWVDNSSVSISVGGIDARTALLALDLLRQRNPMYQAIRVDSNGVLKLIQHLFKQEFGTDMPAPEMAVAIGAQYNSNDAECMISLLRNMSAPY